jgi:protein transport protein SEC31
LATTSYNGTSVVWDLKQKRPIVPFTNSQNKKRYSSLAWNPELSTQLVTASEDDNLPVIELWDLRKAYAPVREYHGHTKGVLSVSWCPDDSNLLVSCGKDNRTLIWNPNSGEILGELPTSNNWMYDVQWSKRPSILSTASFDGKISVLSLQDSSASVEVGEFARDQLGGNQTVTPKGVFKTAPKWLQRPTGAVFGFGGRLVHFAKDAKSKKINVYGVSADPEIAQRSQELEKALTAGQFTEYCDKKITQTEDEESKNIWNILKILFERDRSAQLLHYLGFDKEAIASEVSQKLAGEEDGTSEESSDIEPELKLKASTVDELIRRSVLVQNFEDAVNVALKSGRLADALILSTCGGSELWEKTKQQYFALQKRKDMKIIGAILNNKLDDVVQESDLDNWKETLSVVASCQNPNQFRRLSDALAQRLETEKSDVSASTLCYMLSGNVERVTTVLVQRITDAKGEDTSFPREKLLDFVEIISVFKAATQTSDEALLQLKPEIASIYTEFAYLLSNQGQDLLPIALRYLNIISNGNESPETAALRHRVYYSVPQPFGPVPTIPFQIREPRPVQPVQQQQQQQQPVQQRQTGLTGPTGPTTNAPRTGFTGPVSNFGVKADLRPPPQINTQQQQPFIQGGLSPQIGTGPFMPSPISTHHHHPSVAMGPPTAFGGNMGGGPQPPTSVTGTGVPPTHVPTAFGGNMGGGPQQPQDLGVFRPIVPPSNTPPPFTTTPPVQQISMGPPPTTTTTFTPPPTTQSPPQQVVEREITPSTPQPSQPTTQQQTKAESPKPQVELPSDLSKIVDSFQNASDATFSGNVPSVLKAKKRMIENGIQSLSKVLSDRSAVSENLLIELIQLSEAVEAKNMKTANNCVKKITEDHWEQSKDFIKGIKFLVGAMKQ